MERGPWREVREPWAREWAPAWVCALHRKGRRRQYTTLHNTTICNDITHFHCLYTIVSRPTSLGSDPVILYNLHLYYLFRSKRFARWVVLPRSVAPDKRYWEITGVKFHTVHGGCLNGLADRSSQPFGPDDRMCTVVWMSFYSIALVLRIWL